MGYALNLKGQKFGKLTILEYAGKCKSNKTLWQLPKRSEYSMGSYEQVKVALDPVLLKNNFPKVLLFSADKYSKMNNRRK